MKTSAKIIADSIANGVRLTTMELHYQRFIHSEFMTHRMFSRNASSSRAIPIRKMINQVRENPAMPIYWGEDKPGMQAELALDAWDEATCENMWLDASLSAVKHAEALNGIGLHKQTTNRLLEPFQWIKVIVTATEWDNFFDLRLHKDAQPEIRDLAIYMKRAMNESTPVKLSPGDYHLPYVKEDEICMAQVCDSEPYCINLDDLIKCSVARCARVSYMNHDNTDPDVEKDIALADRLLESKHLSPFEHIATPMTSIHCTDWEQFWDKGTTHMDGPGQLWSSNFRGFIQYRNLL